MHAQESVCQHPTLQKRPQLTLYKAGNRAIVTALLLQEGLEMV
jgi:hypothetical protein